MQPFFICSKLVVGNVLGNTTKNNCYTPTMTVEQIENRIKRMATRGGL